MDKLVCKDYICIKLKGDTLLKTIACTSTKLGALCIFFEDFYSRTMEEMKGLGTPGSRIGTSGNWALFSRYEGMVEIYLDRFDDEFLDEDVFTTDKADYERIIAEWYFLRDHEPKIDKIVMYFDESEKLVLHGLNGEFNDDVKRELGLSYEEIRWVNKIKKVD